jgi:hypothetical protein
VVGDEVGSRTVMGGWPITSASAERTMTDSSKSGLIGDIGRLLA